ncbi:FemAB family XrtA/PEP-CTERM system-associated protein [Neptunomonas sp. XY-337]|uniref:FemAB family XrtA/PEP-CTERM system-associated protein n=1 Tax=Neptunomonas sp. XY-337 TaxID=2561897 RepID=UPI0010A9A0B1|nr:FemAB family XrtA/PEP-CTERM system-associated protein [Neptunomonas sp. XY-337]
MSLQILELSESKFEQWDAFVAQADSATFFHRAGWKRVIERAFKHRTYFLYAEEDGAIVGVLPLVHIKSRLFGSALTSTPFCVYGGIVALNEQAEAELRMRACELAKELKVSALEMRNIEQTSSGWPTKELYYTFRKSLSEDNEENMLAIPRKRRAMIRGGIKANLQSEEDSGWERFFATYAESVRNLGTPVFSQKLFRCLREEFGKDCRVLMITHEGKDVAGLMSFYFKDQVLPYYAGSFDSAKHLKAHDFMYWELMRRSVDEGYRVFDFGRSKKDTGPYLFKKGWGFEPELLNYEFFLVESDSIPEVNPNNPKYKLFIDMWKKLPLPVANRLGPLLSRSLG